MGEDRAGMCVVERRVVVECSGRARIEPPRWWVQKVG